MKKTVSVKKTFDFRKTLNYGKFSRGRYISVYILKRKKEEPENQNLFGICVSKKHGNSVVRNKLKRWAREGYTKIEEFLKEGYIIVVLYKKNVKEALESNEIDFFKIEEEMKEQLYSLEMIKNEEK
ncbi:MAG: ribonuclease P protein component [Clostridia bacterium]|nr:ribonuclease P protein component [Clostridia bacterium]